MNGKSKSDLTSVAKDKYERLEEYQERLKYDDF